MGANDLEHIYGGGNAPMAPDPAGEPLAPRQDGPRIVINPTTFRNKKDAVCVAWNEGIRVFMETNGVDPRSEPTPRQRKFFADTAYADDETQLRRTILARIATMDTSVKDPTNDQLQETAEVLRAIVDSGFAKTDEERDRCMRLAEMAETAVRGEPIEPADGQGSPQPPEEPAAQPAASEEPATQPAEEPEVQAAEKGGRRRRLRNLTGITGPAEAGQGVAGRGAPAPSAAPASQQGRRRLRDLTGVAGAAAVAKAARDLRGTKVGSKEWAEKAYALVDAHRAAYPRSQLFAQTSDGKWANPERVNLLVNVLADPSSVPSVNGMMQYYYGADAAKVSDSVIEKRLRAGGTNRNGRGAVQDVSSVTGAFGGHGAVRTAFDRRNVLGQVVTSADSPAVVAAAGSAAPLAEARRAGDSSGRAVHWSSGVSYVPMSDLDSSFHEVLGHGLNPIFSQPGQPKDPSNVAIPGSADTWGKRKMYYVANDAELSAELGNLRKMSYRYLRNASDGKPIDAGTPEGFRAVYRAFAADPSSPMFNYLPPSTRRMLEGIRELREYDARQHPNDNAVTRGAINARREYLERVLGSPDEIGQVVVNDPGPADEGGVRADVKGGAVDVDEQEEKALAEREAAREAELVKKGQAVEPVQQEPTQREPTQREPTQREPTQREPAFRSDMIFSSGWAVLEPRRPAQRWSGGMKQIGPAMSGDAVREGLRMKQIGPATSGVWDGRMKQIGPPTQGVWDGSMRQIGVPLDPLTEESL